MGPTRSLFEAQYRFKPKAPYSWSPEEAFNNGAKNIRHFPSQDESIHLKIIEYKDYVEIRARELSFELTHAQATLLDEQVKYDSSYEDIMFMIGELLESSLTSIEG